MSKLCNFDTNDLQSLNWLTSGNLPCLQQHQPAQAEFSMSAQDQLHAGAQLSNMSAAGAGTSMVHVQNNMQHSPLGINSMPFSPSFPSPASVYQPPSQQVMTFPQSNQQCSHGALYNTFNNQSLFTHQQIHTPHSQETQPKTFPKPIFSYSCLIAMALKNSKTGSLPTAPDGWKNSVRHNLSLNKCFEKVENKLSGSSRKGCLWALNPAKIEKMEEEMQKWKRKDLPAIRRSMANPDELDKLITDRPECCKRNMPDPQLPSPLPQPVRPPQCLKVLHQLQLQLQSQPHIAPMSPAPAQTPPFQPVPDLVRHTPPPLTASLPHPPQQQQQQPAEIFNSHSDVHPEADVLDPGILDFDLQEKLWDEMKDDSFNLEDLGSFSNSPLHFSDCDLECVNQTPVSSTEEIPFSGVYTSYNTVDGFPNQYINTQGSSQPIVLH
ncbi:Forkhead box protein N4 [Bagarius yarrelli]|uniref:Forkhead box protein N4 n=1 Tax=Bagarius yarrelli TaxID=175774 RepID=A0A556V197_BAGYA|nr:Forkhead box protein N4 [Bagarius yarrelli]